MGWYTTWLFPALCDWALDQPAVERHRRDLLAVVSGQILEIGVGTGLNLPCYPPSIRHLATVEPNRGMHRRLQRRIHETGISVDRREAGAEKLPFEDAQFDFVVSTFTLCSVEDVDEVLRDVWRVLKAGGRFVFLEHGLSPIPRIQRAQRRWNWLQSLFGDGCRLDRDFRQIIASGPFPSWEIRNFELEKTPQTHGYMYHGIATKSSPGPIRPPLVDSARGC